MAAARACLTRAWCADLAPFSDSLHGGEIYGAEQRGRLIQVVPVNDGHTIALKWVVPCQRALWAEGAASFLAHLIGHEGAGSLFSLLKAKGWAKALWAGDYAPVADTSLFSVTLSLTNAGAQSSVQRMPRACALRSRECQC